MINIDYLFIKHINIKKILILFFNNRHNCYTLYRTLHMFVARPLLHLCNPDIDIQVHNCVCSSFTHTFGNSNRSCTSNFCDNEVKGVLNNVLEFRYYQSMT